MPFIHICEKFGEKKSLFKFLPNIPTNQGIAFKHRSRMIFFPGKNVTAEVIRKWSGMERAALIVISLEIAAGSHSHRPKTHCARCFTDTEQRKVACPKN